MKTKIEKAENVEVKPYSVEIEPMYIGTGKGKRLEQVVNIKIYISDKKAFATFQAIVPPKSRLDQEVAELLKVCNEQIKKNG